MAKQKTIKVDGKEYTLQHPGAKWYLECIDRNKNRFGVLQSASYTEELFTNVIVDPEGVKLEDFGDNLAAVTKLTTEIENFLSSK